MHKIRDSGSSISPKFMSKLFEKFIADSQIWGTGQGIYITRKWEDHGKKKWAFNKDNVGSAFIFSLPMLFKLNNEKFDKDIHHC